MNWSKNFIFISQYVSLKIGRRNHHENVRLLFAVILKIVLMHGYQMSLFVFSW